MLRENEIFRLIEGAARILKEEGILKDGYFMLREPQVFCLMPKPNGFDVSIKDEVWKRGTQPQQAAAIALSTLGCDLSDKHRLGPVGVETETDPFKDYKMWRQNFKRCYTDLKALKASDGSKANSCVFTMVHPVLNPKPCVIYAQFGTYAGKLQLTVNARATHLFMLYEDLLRYIHLQLLFSSLLDFSLGDLFFISNNFHVLSNQRRSITGYLNLRPKSARFLAPSTLSLKDYESDRRHIGKGKFGKIKWDTIKNLVHQRYGSS